MSEEHSVSKELEQGERSSEKVVATPAPAASKPQSEPKWYAVTYRGTAEMTVWVKAESAADAKRVAEEEYEDATQVEFVKGRPYTMKAKPAPEYSPPEEWEFKG